MGAGRNTKRTRPTQKHNTRPIIQHSPLNTNGNLSPHPAATSKETGNSHNPPSKIHLAHRQTKAQTIGQPNTLWLITIKHKHASPHKRRTVTSYHQSQYPSSILQHTHTHNTSIEMRGTPPLLHPFYKVTRHREAKHRYLPQNCQNGGERGGAPQQARCCASTSG
jgi:hypothetical protein